jgi:hypothetical protein
MAKIMYIKQNNKSLPKELSQRHEAHRGHEGKTNKGWTSLVFCPKHISKYALTEAQRHGDLNMVFRPILSKNLNDLSELLSEISIFILCAFVRGMRKH